MFPTYKRPQLSNRVPREGTPAYAALMARNAEFDAAQDAQWETFMGGDKPTARKASAGIGGVTEEQVVQLQAMIDWRGIRAVIKSLCEIAHNTADAAALCDNFDSLETDGDAWQALAEKLDQLAASPEAGAK